MLWAELVWPASTGVRFGGLWNLRAPALHRAVDDLLKRSRCQRFDSYYAKLSQWLSEVDHALATADQKHRWLMPQGDTFPSSEERRLFYVALTRARRSVAMFTVAGRRSSFLQELIDEGVIVPCDDNGQAIKQSVAAEPKSDRATAGSATAQAPAEANGLPAQVVKLVS